MAAVQVVPPAVRPDEQAPCVAAAARQGEVSPAVGADLAAGGPHQRPSTTRKPLVELPITSRSLASNSFNHITIASELVAKSDKRRLMAIL